MTKMAFRQRLNAKPLLKIRLFALFLVLTGLVSSAIAFLAEINGEMTVSDDFYKMVFLSIISALPILFILDRVLSRCWIKKEALIITTLSQDFANAFLKDRALSNPKQMMFIPYALFSGMILYNLGFYISDGYYFMWIPTILILISFLYYLASLLEKRSTKDKKIYISEFGMIYLDDLVLWNDKLIYLTYIADLKIVDDLREGSNLYLKIDFYGVRGSRFIEYYVSIPQHKAQDLVDIIKRIQLVNQENKELASKKRH